MCSYSFFFFKQKTAYEMRISDWSSDVCSSDLIRACIKLQKLADLLKGEAGRLRLADEPQAADIFRPIAPNAMVARWCVEKAPALVEAHGFHAHIARLGKFSDRERQALLIPYHGTDPIRSEEHTSEIQSLM